MTTPILTEREMGLTPARAMAYRYARASRRRTVARLHGTDAEIGAAETENDAAFEALRRAARTSALARAFVRGIYAAQDVGVDPLSWACRFRAADVAGLPRVAGRALSVGGAL